MKRFMAFVVAIVGLGMMLSGCVAGTTRVKDAYIEKNYIDKVKVPESKRVGDRNIKFYVGKVVDERKDKAVYVKRIGLGIGVGDTEFANTELTIRHITEKALFNTGWGVVKNENKADFVVETELKDFMVHWGTFLSPKITESNICILDKNGKNVLKRKIYKETKALAYPDMTAEWKYVVGDMSVQYYTALIDYFSSPEFVKAIKRAYREENDDSTISR